MRGDFLETRHGYCECGCGEKTGIASQSKTSRGWVIGEPKRFIRGHNGWKGGRHLQKNGNTSYVLIHKPEHPRRNRDGYVMEHIVVAEEVFGCPLPPGSIVHHVDGDGLNNDKSNLMVFNSNATHIRFHAMQRRLGREKNANNF